MATDLEIVVGTYEEFLLGYRVRPSRSVSIDCRINFRHVFFNMLFIYVSECKEI